jgi:aspartate oxidase
MWQRAGLVRTGESLREGLAELSALERSFGSTRLRGPLLVARTVLRGALLDGKSRGCHYRRDAEPGETAGPPEGERAVGHG